MNNNFLSRLVMLLGAVVLTCNVAWGDAQFDEVYIKYTLDNKEYGATFKWNNFNGDFLNGATITDEAKITKVYMKYRKYNGNVCGGQLCYNYGDVNWSYHGNGTWTFDNNCWDFEGDDNAGSQLKNESFDLLIANKYKASGKYTMYYNWQLWGALTSSENCSHNWYMKQGENSDVNYQVSYTILPPTVKEGTPAVSAEGYLSGSGTTEDPWLVTVGQKLTLTGTAEPDWSDANSGLRISNNSDTKTNYQTSLVFNSDVVTEKCTVTVKFKYYNASADLISSNSRSKTIYYQFVQPRTVNFDAGTGSVTPTSLTEETYRAGITLPSATPRTECTTAGWTFAGWAKASQTGTAIAPELLAAGANYKPTSDGETLYAVYKITQGGTPSDDFVKITSAPTDWSGDYIIAKETNAMNGTLTSGKFGNTTVEITDNTITSTNTSIIWTFTAGTTAGQYSLKNNSANKYANITGTSTENAALSDNPVYFTIESSSTAGIWKVVSVDYNERCFSYYSSGSDWRTYAKSSNTTGNLYKRAAGTGTTTYNSNPIAGEKCAITWVVNGDTLRTDLLNNGETINKPADPASINNRVFVGWSATEITGHANTFTNFTSHTCTGAAETWYAVFATAEYTATSDLTNGGTYIITSQKDGKTVYLPNAAATGDSPILGTAIDVDGSTISTVVTSDMLWTFDTIDGGWQIQSVIEQDKYLGTTTSEGKTVRVNKSYDKAWTIADNTMKYNTTNNFIGPKADEECWYANSSSTSKTFASTTITFYTSANTYRNYTTAPSAETYSVVYNLNGGTGTAVNQHELLSGTEITLPVAPTLAGSTFSGWNDGSQTYAAGASYTIGSANVTLTAQWGTLTPTSITITVPQEVVNAELIVEQEVQLGLTFEPAGLLDEQKAVTWSVKSGDESLISVSETGLVSALACGESATIYATSNVDANIKGEYIFHIKMPACENYSFHYGNNDGSGWNYYCDPICFTESEISDGTQTGHLWFADFVLPANDKEFYVGWQNSWATNEQNYFASAKDNFSNMFLHHYHHVDSEKQIKLSSFGDLSNAGAIGKLCVWGGYSDNNKYVDFVPGGYVLRLGSGENWTSYEFAPNDETNILETTWTTDFMTLTSEIISGNAYVALKANNTAGFVSTPNQTEDKVISGNMGIKTGAGDNWKDGNITEGDAGRHGKFRIWVDNNTKNFCCHFVPYYQIAFNTEGGSAVAPGYVSIEADSKSYTVTMSDETNPTRVGYQFVGWNDGSTTHTTTWTINDISQDINLTAEWNKVNTLTFHYKGFTTDCDEQRSVATGEQVTLPDGKVVSGKTFEGWSDGVTTYQAGASYTMPANDVTLTASYTNWTITLNYNGTTQTPEVLETGVVLPTTVPETAQGAVNNIFIGFTKTALEEAITDLPADFIAAGETYLPTTAGEILYALYRQGDTEYKLIKDIKDLRLGAHVVLASIDEDYAMGKEFIAGQDTLPAIVVTKDGDNETISFGKDVQEWVLTTSSEAGRDATYQGTWVFQRSDNKKLASPNRARKITLGTNVSEGSSFRIAIDASGRATAQCVANYNINTLSMGDNGAFGCYNPNTIDAPDLAIYQHIGTKYVTTPAPVYRVKSVDMVNGRIDKNDYYEEGTEIDLDGYANEGYSTSNVYRVYNEATHDTISKTKMFTMPAYNVVDTLTNRAFVDTLKFVVPECVTPTPSNIRANGSTEVNLPNDVANVNSWNFVGWTKIAINDTSEVHSEIFTTYTTPRLKKDSAETFYAIYSYDGLETDGFVLSTTYNATTYYLGEYVSGSNNRYFSAVTDKAQALVLYLEEIEAIEAIEAIERKLYYNFGDAKVYLKADNSSSTNILTTTNEADATVWTITTEDGKTSIKTTINDQERYLRFNYNGGNSRYNIYSTYSDPVSEKALSYTTNPVCAQYAYYFVSDGAETPEYVYELGQDGKVIPYSPANECDAKRFIGWSETKVTALQQSAPSMVDVATQTYDRDVTLYAVYAAENGGKIAGDAPTTTDDVTAMASFKTAQVSGMTSLNTRYYYHNAELYDNTLRLKNGKTPDSSYITTSLIRDLEKIQVVYITGNTKPIVSISSDGSVWTQIALNKVSDSDIYYATPGEPGDYYVAFSIKTSSSDNYSYSRISSVTYTHNKQYWYSDYSTNCNTAPAATITYAESSETAHQATSIGEVITLPTPKTEGKRFEGWTINGVNYAGGESYKLSYDVTATATWTAAQLTCDVETLYVTSAKGITTRSSMVAHISCPDITTGTLTIADVDNSSSIFHAVITNPEASAETGLNATVAIEFTPNAQNVNRNATMTAIIGGLEKTFQVHGTSLPDQFVIAHQNNDKWYALPADITAFGTYTGYEITVDGDNATAPQSAVYNLYADSTDETHKNNPEIVRLAAPNGGRALQAQAADKTNIKVGDSIQYAVDSTYKWIIQTTDNENYTFLNAKTGRTLNYSGGKFGTYTSGESLRIFKVTTTTVTIPVTVVNWTENGFSFTTTETIPVYDNFCLLLNDVAVETASCTPNNALYDVTSSTAFGAQNLIQMQWYKDSKPVATATVVSPARVTENTTLSSLLIEGIDTKSLDIVASSGTLTVDAKATIHNLDIYPGATVTITNDTLTTTTLSFHGGLTSTESNYDYEVPRLYIAKDGTAPGYIKMQTHVYYYLNVNSDHFYPFTVPYKTTIANIRYASKPNTNIQSIYGSAIKISRYDGEARGKGDATTTKYWKDLSYSNDLIPGVGYIITAKRLKGESYASLRIMMMVSDIDATTDTVAVGAWGVDDEKIAWYNQGWNYIANPYTAMLAGNNADDTHHAIQSGTEIRYATVPSPVIDGYDQVPMNDAELKPFYGFFIQAGNSGNYHFVKNTPQAVPAYLLAEEKPEQEAYISLEGAAMRDRFGLIVGPGHTNDYEINADLTKELGSANDLRAWLMAGETKMAYLAIDDETARTLIPLNLRTPSEGEYTFSLRGSSRVEDLEGVYLYDYENGTVTNIINSDYTFSAPAGAVENRFALSAIRQNKAPTDIGGGTDRPIGAASSSLKADRLKMVKDGHIYIIVNGVTFNAEGKEVTK